MFQIVSFSDKCMRLVQNIWEKFLPGLSGYSCSTVRVKKTNLSTWICALYVTAVTASVCRSVLLVFVFLRTHQPSHLPQPSHVINKSGDNKEVSCSVWLRLWLQRAHSSTPADLNNDEELEYSGWLSVVPPPLTASSRPSSPQPGKRKPVSLC